MHVFVLSIAIRLIVKKYHPTHGPMLALYITYYPNCYAENRYLNNILTTLVQGRLTDFKYQSSRCADCITILSFVFSITPFNYMIEIVLEVTH